MEYLPIFIQIKNRPCLVVGGGSIAARKVALLRKAQADVTVVAPDLCSELQGLAADGLIQHLAAHRPPRVVLITECSMSDNVAVEFPDTEFIRPCNLCPHMKRITLPKIYESLETLEPRVEIDPQVAEKARRAVERMVQHG